MKVPRFDPKSFGKLGASPRALAMWQFLTRRRNTMRLIIATELGHAALDGVVVHLESAYGDWLEEQRYRQLVGAMVRQIMESLGYRVQNVGVRVRLGMSFRVAARYTRLLEEEHSELELEPEEYLEEVSKRLEWMASRGHSLEERQYTAQLEHDWIAERYEPAVAQTWLSASRPPRVTMRTRETANGSGFSMTNARSRSQ